MSPISEQRIPARTVTVVRAGRSPILDEIGGPPLEVRHLPEVDRQAAFMLCHELRVACGSLDRSSGGGRYELSRNRGSWRSPRDVSPEMVQHVVRRTERVFPNWTLTLEPTGDIHADVERFLIGDAR